MENNHTIENNKIEKEEKGEEENVKIITNDDKEFIVSLKIVRMSSVLTELINNIGINEPINLPNIDSLTFNKILEYCNHYVDKQKEEQEQINNLKKSIIFKVASNYFSTINDNKLLLKIILGSNYLGIHSLFLLSCKHLALQFEVLNKENKLNDNELNDNELNDNELNDNELNDNKIETKKKLIETKKKLIEKYLFFKIIENQLFKY